MEFFHCVAAVDFALVVGEVAGAECDADGEAFEFVFGEFPAWFLFVVIVEEYGYAFGFEARYDFVGLGCYGVALVFGLIDWDDDDLRGREFWGEDKAVVVGVCHDECAHETSGGAPGGGPYVVGFAFAVHEGDVEGFGEVLAEEV